MRSRELRAQVELPYLPTPGELINTIISLIAPKISLLPFPTMVDLGSGDGRVVIAFAQALPSLECVGYEISTSLVAASAERAKTLGLYNCCFHHEDLFSVDLSEVGLVFSFCLPDLMKALMRRITSLPSHAILASIAYPLSLEPDSFRILSYIKKRGLVWEILDNTRGKPSDRQSIGEWQAFVYEKIN